MFFLKKLYIKNFLSFCGEHTLFFPRNGLLALKGECNGNVARSNGAGKSSLLEAIAYVFDYCSSPATALQNWDTDEEFRVKLYLGKDNQDIVIERGPGLYIVICDGILYKAGQAKDFIKNLIYTPELIAFMTYRPQGVKGNFLELNNIDKYDFLTNLLDLTNIEHVVNNANLFLKEIEKSITEKKVLIESYEREDKNMLQYKEDLKKKLTEYKYRQRLLNDSLYGYEKQLKEDSLLDEQRLKDLTSRYVIERNHCLEKGQAEIKNIQNKISNLKYEHELKYSELVNELTKFKTLADNTVSVEYLSNRIADLENDLNKKSEKLKITDEAIKFVNDKKQKVPQLTSQLNSLVNNRCFTCNQVFHSGNEELIKSIRNELMDIQKLERSYLPKFEEEHRLYLEGIFIVKKNIQECKIKIENYNKKNALQDALDKYELKYQSTLDDLEKNKKYAELNLTKNLQEIDNKVANVSKELQHQKELEHQSLRNKISSLKLQIHEHQKVIDDLHLQITNLEEKLNSNKVSSLNEQINDLVKKQKLEFEVANCLGKENFSSLIFEEFLYSIAQQANAYIKTIPCVSCFHLEFETEKLTQKGTVKKGIVLKVYKNGIERPFKMLSGGEKCAINLGIDVAISKILSSRSGKTFGWLICDESFDGMEIFSKIESLDFLKRMAEDKLIIIVEHTNDLNEIFDKRITIKKMDDKSEIKTDF